MTDHATDYMVPDPVRKKQDLATLTEPFHFMQTHRNTWVCMTCFANVDEHYRKQHAYWHAIHRQLPTERIRPQPHDALEKKRILFRVDVAYCDGEYWIQKVEIM